MLDALFVSLPWAGALVYVLYQHAEERRHLLNRIQAPRETVQQSIAQELEDTPEASFDPSESFALMEFRREVVGE